MENIEETISICKELYLGYISKENNISRQESSLLLKKCIDLTSKKLNISIREVEKIIFSIYSISRTSFNLAIDRKEVKKDVLKIGATHKKYYYDGAYIYDKDSEGAVLLGPDQFSQFLFTLLNKYKYINPENSLKPSYIMKLNNMSLPSVEWKNIQIDYVNGLSLTNRLIIKSYTGPLSYFINSYVRKGRVLDRRDVRYLRENRSLYENIFICFPFA